MRNVLIISQSKIIGGAEIVLADYLRGNHAYSFYICTSPELKEFYADCLPIDHIIVSEYFRKFETDEFLNIIGFFVSIAASVVILRKTVKDKKISVLYANNSYDVLIVFAAGLFLRKVKKIAHIHDTLRTVSFLSIVLRLMKKKLDVILVPSSETAAHYRNILGNEIPLHVVHNGINAASIAAVTGRFGLREKYSVHGKHIIGVVGRIDNNKRIDLFLDVLAELSMLRKDFSGVVIGNSIDPALYKALVEDVQIRQIPVTFIPALSRTDIMQIYREIDCTMVNSDKETFSMVTIEAMANSCIVFARNVGGIIDILEDGKNGFTYDYNQTAAGIADKLNVILSLSDNKKNAVRSAAYHRAAHEFTSEKKVLQVNAVIGAL